MSRYVNKQQSGTMYSTVGAKEPLDNVIDRVMAIAHRLVQAENAIKSHAAKIREYEQKIEDLEVCISELAKAQAKTKTAPKTTPKTTAKTTTETTK